MYPKSFFAQIRRISEFCLVILYSSLLAGCQVSPNALPSSTPQPVRTVGESTLDIVEVWRFHTGPPNSWDSTLPHLFVTGGKVVISYGAGQRYGDENFASWLTALSLETGQVIWQTRLVDPSHGTNIASAHQDNERLYLVYSSRVSAFDLGTGQLLWSTPDLGQHVSYWFVPWESGDPLLLHSSERERIAIDPQIGTVLSRQPDDPEWLKVGQIEFVPTRQGLYAVDQQTEQVLWERLELQPAYRQLQRWPSVVGSDIVFESGDPCYNIIRANIRTGQVAWQTERVYLSNFAIIGSRLYALREDMMLVAFDLDSGAIAGTLKFNGLPSQTICTHSGSDVYWVVAKDDYIVVYLGDSCELIVLKTSAKLQP